MVITEIENCMEQIYFTLQEMNDCSDCQNILVLANEIYCYLRNERMIDYPVHKPVTGEMFDF